MEYSIFKRIVTRYIEENYDGLEVLSKYNKPVQDKIHEYIYPILKGEYGDTLEDVKKAIKICQEYENRFYRECLK